MIISTTLSDKYVEQKTLNSMEKDKQLRQTKHMQVWTTIEQNKSKINTTRHPRCNLSNARKCGQNKGQYKL